MSRTVVKRLPRPKQSSPPKRGAPRQRARKTRAVQHLDVAVTAVAKGARAQRRIRGLSGWNAAMRSCE